MARQCMMCGRNLLARRTIKETYIRDYCSDLIEDFEELAVKRGVRFDTLAKRHIPVHQLVKEEKVLKFIVQIHHWLSMTDSEKGTFCMCIYLCYKLNRAIMKV
jgi:hypothetical protein